MCGKTRACPPFDICIIVHARKSMALKCRAHVPLRLAMGLTCLGLAKRFFTKWRSLCRYESNAELGCLLLNFRGITGFIFA